MLSKIHGTFPRWYFYPKSDKNINHLCWRFLSQLCTVAYKQIKIKCSILNCSKQFSCNLWHWIRLLLSSSISTSSFWWSRTFPKDHGFPLIFSSSTCWNRWDGPSSPSSSLSYGSDKADEDDERKYQAGTFTRWGSNVA